MRTRSALRDRVQRRLNDTDGLFWTAEEIEGYLTQGYREIARQTRIFWDQLYLEDLPASFSMTQEWERAFADFDCGVANYTMADERRLLTEHLRLGPANHTSPFEATDGHLSDAGADTSIPATATVPEPVSAIDRALWDKTAIIAISPRDAAMLDPHYRTNEGPVVAYLWEQDGVRTVRKVRVPATQADTYAIVGSWGFLRDPTDIFPVDADASDPWAVGAWAVGALAPGSWLHATHLWGFPRRIPGFHPMGYDTFGPPRRPYRDGSNVRIEHWRDGRPVDSDLDTYELPQRMTVAVECYALAECYRRQGPAQDVRLAQHYEQRYVRAVARVAGRVRTVSRQRVGVMGSGQTPRAMGRPPRPRLPSNYGVPVRGA
jgi:hypothetical protein